jgi:hypothetical protein
MAIVDKIIPVSITLGFVALEKKTSSFFSDKGEVSFKTMEDLAVTKPCSQYARFLAEDSAFSTERE